MISLAPSPEAAIQRSDDVVTQEVRDDVVLVHLSTNRIFDLATSTARLWSLLDGTRGRDEVVRILLEEYDVDRERLEADVDRTLATLARHDLIRLEGAA